MRPQRPRPLTIYEHGPKGPRDVFLPVRSDSDAEPFTSERARATRVCILAMLPRTGSTALCSLLEQTKLVGMPHEYFNPRGPIQHFAKLYRARDANQYTDTLLRERVTPNGVFCLKVNWYDFEPLASLLPTLFGSDVRFVYLTRDDLVAQAISLFIARQSGLWHRDRAGKPYSSPNGGGRDVAFDGDEITREIRGLERHRQSWETFFAQSAVAPLRITYEELLEDPTALVRKVVSWVGYDWNDTVTLHDATTTRLADTRNQDWARRIRESLRP